MAVGVGVSVSVGVLVGVDVAVGVLVGVAVGVGVGVTKGQGHSFSTVTSKVSSEPMSALPYQPSGKVFASAILICHIIRPSPIIADHKYKSSQFASMKVMQTRADGASPV